MSNVWDIYVKEHIRLMNNLRSNLARLEKNFIEFQHALNVLERRFFDEEKKQDE